MEWSLISAQRQSLERPLRSVAIDEPRRTTALQAADLVVYELGRKLTNPNRYPFKNLMLCNPLLWSLISIAPKNRSLRDARADSRT